MQKKIRTVGIFTPFPQTIGGGERYIFTLAESFSRRGFHVKILSPFKYNIEYLSKTFDLKLNNCTYKKTLFTIFFIPPLKKQFYYFFSLSNHLIPPVWGHGHFNSLIVQFPFPFPTIKFADKIQKLIQIPKLMSYQKIICYSHYSKKWIIKKLPKNINNPGIYVIYPPVNTKLYQGKSKKNIILCVGRFFAGDHNKQHILLIQAFKQLYNKGSLKNWELHLAGSLVENHSSKEYIEKISNAIKNYPIFLHINVSNNELKRIYANAKIFWHATGYNNNEYITPEKSEHFGTVIIEAMSSGAIPVVFKGGGTKEIISDNINGLFWESLIELKKNTIVLKNNYNFYRMSRKAKIAAKQFDVEKFYNSINKLFQ